MNILAPQLKGHEAIPLPDWMQEETTGVSYHINYFTGKFCCIVF